MIGTVKNIERRGYHVSCIVSDIQTLGALVTICQQYDGAMEQQTFRKEGGALVTFQLRTTTNTKLFHELCQTLCPPSQT